jgi:hypothetical protein
MIQLLRQFRGLAVALAVLAISAGAVFAGAPHFAPATVPVAQFDPAAEPTASPDENADEDQDEDVNEDQDEDAGETAEAPEAPAGAEDGAPTDTHGFMVSAAAQMETPEEFANHGAFVSCVAHLTEVVDPMTVTLEQCTAADQAKTAEKAAKGAEKSAKGAAKAAAGKAHGHGRPTEG